MADKSGYKLLNISLVESNFKRIAELDQQAENYTQGVNVDIEHEQGEENKLLVFLNLYFWGGINKQKGEEAEKQVEAKIKMLGIFTYPDEPEVSIETFGEINGPAIIFPFVREHLANMSLKASMEPIYLPPINFVNLSKRQKEAKNTD